MGSQRPLSGSCGDERDLGRGCRYGCLVFDTYRRFFPAFRSTSSEQAKSPTANQNPPNTQIEIPMASFAHKKRRFLEEQRRRQQD